MTFFFVIVIIIAHRVKKYAKVRGKNESRFKFALFLQNRLDEITEAWSRYRHTISVRLRIADELNRLLRRIREDEYYHQAVNDRLKSAANGAQLVPSGVEIRVSQQMRESEIIRIHTDMLEVQSRLEFQQQAMQRALDEVRLTFCHL